MHHKPRRRARTTPRQMLNTRRRCPFLSKGLTTIDYKDVELLSDYINDDGKIKSSRVSNVSALMQRKLALAIKRARFLALLPYTDQHSLLKK